MSVLDRILFELKKRGLSDTKFQELATLPTGSVRDWRRGKTKSYMRHIPDISLALNISSEELLKEDEIITSQSSLDPIDYALLKKFQMLDAISKNMVTYIVDVELSRITPDSQNENTIIEVTETTEKEVFYRRLPLYDVSLCGNNFNGKNIFDAPKTEVNVPGDVPISANLGVRICGDHFAPSLPSGSIIWIHQQKRLNTGDKCLVLIKGIPFCKIKRDGYFESIEISNDNYIVHDYESQEILGKIVAIQKFN